MNFLDVGYLGAGYVASPFFAYKMLTDSRYRHRLDERFGLAPTLNGGRRRIWFHAASVGETAMLRPVVAGLDCDTAISTMTIGGRNNAKKLFPDAPVFYFPFDFSGSVRSALSRVKPDLIVLVELEVWPNFMIEAERAGIPVVVINGRISDKSFGRYRMLDWFFRTSFRRLAKVGASNDIVAERMRSLGARNVEVTGNLKYDLVADMDSAAERRTWLKTFGWKEGTPVLFGGSTHAPEEAFLVGLYKSLLPSMPDLKLLIAPRHLHRMAEVEKVIEESQLPCYKKSQISGRSAPEGVGILDTVGELSRAYSVASVVFIGGTLGTRGGQNMLEPAVHGKPVVAGPSLHNFRHVSREIADAGGMLIGGTASEVGERLSMLLRDPETAAAMGGKARRVTEAGRGALGRTVGLIESMLEPRRKA